MSFKEEDLRKRSKTEYYYLNEENSVLFDSVKDSKYPKDETIKRLILEIAAASRSTHCMAR